MTEVRCSNCGQPYPPLGMPYRCPICTGFFDFPVLPEFDPNKIENSETGIWRFRHALGLPETAPSITMGEGNTPLVWREAFERQIAFKLDFLNPSGSYKDRGTAVLVSFLRSRAVTQAIEDSSGNAGASFAAYAAAAGIKARVYIPDSASGPKRAQIEAHGAEIVRVLGSRAKTAEVALKAADEGAVYASHAYLPHGIAGYATLAYEIHAQLGQAPGTVVMPAGQGGLLLGAQRGFENLKKAGLITQLPAILGVQAMACAPLWALFSYGSSGLGWVSEGETLAEGVRVRHPLRGDAVIQAVMNTKGRLVAVEESAIQPGRAALARMGFYVEPTSAIVWNALEQVKDWLRDPVVVILTGAGLKSP